MKEAKIVNKMVFAMRTKLSRRTSVKELRGFAQVIYDRHKELGLFTLDDIEIDEVDIEKILISTITKNKWPTRKGLFYAQAKAIADKKPIKIKEK